MTYLDLIRTLAGHRNFQTFEKFVEIVALRQFRSAIVTKTTDQDGLLDFFVRLRDGNLVLIEAKATDDRNEVRTETHLNRLVRSWGPNKLIERLAKNQSLARAIIATTATVEPEFWESHRKKYGLTAFELWDANVLSSFAANDSIIASFFPGAAEREERYRIHSLDGLYVSNSLRLGTAIGDLIREEQQHPSEPLGFNTLIVGPPFIGKTCWAVRRAWRTCYQNPNSSVLWFNALTDSPDDLSFLDDRLPRDEQYVLAVDDFHVARAHPLTWTTPVKSFVENRPNCVRVLWIARDEAVTDYLGFFSRGLSIEPFPTQLIVGLFLERLVGLNIGLRVVAALEAGLDPALGRSMSDWFWDGPPSFDDLCRRIDREKNETVRNRLSDIKNRLKDGYAAYLALLPMGSIATPAEESFVAEITDLDTADLNNVIRSGIAFRSHDAEGRDQLMLTEHPFQLRRTLRYIDVHRTEPRAVRKFARSSGTASSDQLSDAVLCRYIEDADKPEEVIKKLNRHAEWAGVLEPMSSASRFLFNSTADDDLREVTRPIALKLTRTAYPANAREFDSVLDVDLAWWEDQGNLAARNSDETQAGRRLDLIRYEEAYIHYLRGKYAKAYPIFGASIEAGFRAIQRALDPSTRGGSVRSAQYALSNIWVAGLLEQIAQLRHHIGEVLVNNDEADLDRLRGFAAAVAKIHQELSKASEIGPSALQAGLPFVEGARTSLRPGYELPDAGLTIDLSESDFVDSIRRHRFNAWVHSLETSSWLWLFGLEDTCEGTGRSPPPDDMTFRELAPLSDRDSRTYYRYRQSALLFRAARGEKLQWIEPLHVAAMLHAAGSFEYLGDHLLLSWRLADSIEQRSAIAWFLRRLPNVGFNKLSKTALSRLEGIG